MPHGIPFKSRIPPDWPLDVDPTDESGEIDLSLIVFNLSLTPAERLEQNDRAVEFLGAVRAAGRKLGYGHDAECPETLACATCAPHPVRAVAQTVGHPMGVAKTLFYVMAASYLLSAGLLFAARLRGGNMQPWFIAGWAVMGVAAAVLTAALRPGRVSVWAALVAVLGPWMALSLVVDVRHRYWVMVAVDAAGLAAIAFAAYLSFRPVVGSPS